MTTNEKYQKILVVIESKGKGTELGFAFLDLSMLECSLGQFADSPTYGSLRRLLVLYEPECIILPETSGSSSHRSADILSRLAKEYLPSTDSIQTTCKVEDYVSGEMHIRNFCLKELLNAIIFGMAKKFYGLAAVAILFSHLKFNGTLGIRPNGIKFKLATCDGSMIIDSFSAKNLELVRSLNYECEGPTLLSLLKKTKTLMGSRFLRAQIMQPCTSQEAIISRQELIKEIIEHPTFANHLRENLSKLCDVNQAIIRISQSFPKGTPTSILDCIKFLVSIYRTIKVFDDICTWKFSSSDSARHLCLLFDSFQREQLTTITDAICAYIDETRLERLHQLDDYQMCYLIDSRSNRVLEVARKALDETIDDIVEYASIVSKSLGVELQVKYSTGKFVIKSKDASIARKNSIIEVAKGSYTTVELEKLNSRVSQSMDEILLLSASICSRICETAMAHVDALHSLAEHIGLVDFLLSAADYAIDIEIYSFPVFGDAICLMEARHPILGNFDAEPNEFRNFITDEAFIAIRGPNASGKTSFIKKLALLQIMAQMGYPIPAARASMKIFSKLASRLGSDDDFVANSSTFMTEMRDLAYILSCIDENSLVLIDELGRGTAINCGLALTTAICERLLESRATIFFVTHFTHLFRYLETSPRVTLLDLHANLTTIDDGGNVTRLAKNIGLPSAIVQDMVAFTRKLRFKEDDSVQKIIKRKSEKRRFTLKTAYQLAKMLVYSELPEEDLLAQLDCFHREITKILFSL